MKNKPTATCRKFITKTSLITAGMAFGPNTLNATSYYHIRRANDRINVGFIGLGNRGSRLLGIVMNQPDVQVSAFCDMYEPYLLRNTALVEPGYIKDLDNLIPAMGEAFPNKVERYSDFRKLLENKDTDAVVFATTDHWYAIRMIEAYG